MNKEQILKEVQSGISEKLNKKVELDTVFSEAGIDSLDLLELVVEVEEKLNVRIEDDELLKIKTVDDVVSILHSKQK